MMSRSQLLVNYNAENNRQEQTQPAQIPGPVVILWKLSSQAPSHLHSAPPCWAMTHLAFRSMPWKRHKYQKTTPFTQTLTTGESWSKKYFWIFFLSLESDFRAKIQLKYHLVHWLSKLDSATPTLGSTSGKREGHRSEQAVRALSLVNQRSWF